MGFMNKSKRPVKWRMQEAGYVLNSEGKLLHRVVCRKVNGPFPSTWVVHHIDENKANNDATNLIAMPRKLHDSMHSAMRKKKCLFNREQIQTMIKSYVNLRPNPSQPIIINVIINPSQVKVIEPSFYFKVTSITLGADKDSLKA